MQIYCFKRHIYRKNGRTVWLFSRILIYKIANYAEMMSLRAVCVESCKSICYFGVDIDEFLGRRRELHDY